MYEVVKALITETSLVKFSIITIQHNFILLPTYVLYKMPLLPPHVKTNSDLSCEAFTEKLASNPGVLKKSNSSDKYHAITRTSSSK
jgi:hypothetical protein